MIEETRRPTYFHSRSRSWKPAYHQPACTTGFPTVAHHSGPNTLCLVCPGCLTVLAGGLRKHPLGQSLDSSATGKWKVSVVHTENSSGNQGKHLYLVTL